MNPYRKLFTTLRELARLRSKYEKPETDAARAERMSRWIFDSTMAGENPLATGALVSSPADDVEEALTAGWAPDVS